MNLKEKDGVTLVALIVTVIVLVVIAGISISMIVKDNGVINKSRDVESESNQQTATETLNLKITKIQLASYRDSGELPTLQYLANELCQDSDIEYVNKTQKVASLAPIDVSDVDSIYTKLKKYPYEFEINSSLQLASIDGVKIASSDENITINKSELENYIKREVAKQLIGVENVGIDDSNSQKLRSNDYKEITFTTTAQTFVAPCDGYFCYALYTHSISSSFLVHIKHYNKDNVLISYGNSSSYNYSHTGDEIYMREGDYIIYSKEANVTVHSSKFFYAEGCSPNS